MSISKKILIGIGILFILLQFVPAKKNMPKKKSKLEITELYDVPEDVLSLLKTSCYDCHSNTTVYPWYNRINPVSWYVASHVYEGKADLNFDKFGSYTESYQKYKLREIYEEIKKDEMPLKSYLLLHGQAELSQEEKEKIINWAKKASL